MTLYKQKVKIKKALEENMHYTKNQKYFKGNDTHYYIGLVLVGLGVILFMMGEMMWIYIVPFQLFVATAMAIVGGLFISIPSSGASNEEEIDNQIKQITNEMILYTTDTIRKEEKKEPEIPILLGNYIFEEGVLVRSGRKDGKYRTSLYSAVVIAFKKESVFIYQSKFSLIEDQKKNDIAGIDYKSEPRASIGSRDYVLANNKKVTMREMIIENRDGLVISFPVMNSIIVDELREKLNDMVLRKKQEG